MYLASTPSQIKDRYIKGPTTEELRVGGIDTQMGKDSTGGTHNPDSGESRCPHRERTFHLRRR